MAVCLIGVNRLRVSIDGVTEQELLDQLNGYIYVYIYIFVIVVVVVSRFERYDFFSISARV